MGDSRSKELSLLLAFDGFEKDLNEELLRQKATVTERQERLFLVENLAAAPVWAQVCGRHAEKIAVTSITDAARNLRKRGKVWASASSQLHRRSELIQEQLRGPRVPELLEFLEAVPDVPCGVWALLDQHTLLAAPAANSVFPAGLIRFRESAEPPSRAYLKLWEVFTVHGVRPARGERVIDLGSCPGGWTWVLASMGCRVVAVDRSPLEPHVAWMPGVQSVLKDAFKVTSTDVGALDWVFSDLICYPERLYELVQEWLAAGVERFVCTLKFRGETDFATMDKFAALPHSRLVHLCANKHEVTWIRHPQFS